jgi:integrase
VSKPKRQIPGVSVYQRGTTWSYRLYLAPDPLTGKRPRENRGGFADEDEAWDEVLKSKAAHDAGRQVKRSPRTVAAFMAEWLETTRTEVKSTTYQNYVDYTRSYVVPIIGERPLQEIKVPVLNLLYRRLLESGRLKKDNNAKMYEYWKARKASNDGAGPRPAEIAKACGTTIYAARSAVLRYRRGRIPVPKSPGLEPKTVKNIHRMLHRAFRDAVAWEYLAMNPAVHASVPRVQRKRRAGKTAPWSVDELAAWLAVAMRDRFAGLWVLAATTGMRRSELAGIMRDDLRLWSECAKCEHRQEAGELKECEKCGTAGVAVRGTLVIEPTRVVVAGRAEDSDGKSDDSVREVAIDPFTGAALVPYLAKLDEERRAFGTAYPDHGKLMAYEDGRLPHPDTVTRMFNRLVDAAGVPRIRLHDVRHTYATLSLDAGVDLKIVSDRIGHSDTSITSKVYVHRSSGHDEAAAALIGKLIGEAIARVQAR